MHGLASLGFSMPQRVLEEVQRSVNNKGLSMTLGVYVMHKHNCTRTLI